MTLFDYLGLQTLCLFVFLLFLWTRYNLFIKKRTQVEEDFADIDIQLQRRYDLIGELVEIVKGYAKHEEKVFLEVSKLRSTIKTEHSVSDLSKLEQKASPLIGSLLAIAENYPTLKASESYRLLMKNMKDTEDTIAHFRKEYNTSVKKYNSSLQTFPNSIVKTLFGFNYAEFFSFVS